MDVAGGIGVDTHEVAAVTAVGQRINEHAGVRREFEVRRALQLEDGRAHEHKKSHHCRDRIARHTEERFVTQPPKDERLARLYLHAPKIKRATKFFEGGLHIIMLAHANPAGSDHRIALGKGTLQRVNGCLHGVRHQRKHARLSAGIADQGRQS